MSVSPSSVRELMSANSKRGQALAEMLIALPLLLLLLAAAVEYGRYAYFSIVVGNAARAGVQYGVQSPITAAATIGMTNAAYSDAQGVAQCSGPPTAASGTCVYVSSATQKCQCANTGAIIDCFSGTCAATDHRILYVQVTVTGRLQFISPRSLLAYVGVPTSLPITDQAVMRDLVQ